MVSLQETWQGTSLSDFFFFLQNLHFVPIALFPALKKSLSQFIPLTTYQRKQKWRSKIFLLIVSIYSCQFFPHDISFPPFLFFLSFFWSVIDISTLKRLWKCVVRKYFLNSYQCHGWHSSNFPWKYRPFSVIPQNFIQIYSYFPKTGLEFRLYFPEERLGFLIFFFTFLSISVLFFSCIDLK